MNVGRDRRPAAAASSASIVAEACVPGLLIWKTRRSVLRYHGVAVAGTSPWRMERVGRSDQVDDGVAAARPVWLGGLKLAVNVSASGAPANTLVPVNRRAYGK